MGESQKTTQAHVFHTIIIELHLYLKIYIYSYNINTFIYIFYFQIFLKILLENNIILKHAFKHYNKMFW